MKRSSVRPSVCLSHHSTAAAACGGFTAERCVGTRYQQQRRNSTRSQHGAQQQNLKHSMMGARAPCGLGGVVE